MAEMMCVCERERERESIHPMSFKLNLHVELITSWIAVLERNGMIQFCLA